MVWEVIPWLPVRAVSLNMDSQCCFMNYFGKSEQNRVKISLCVRAWV